MVVRIRLKVLKYLPRCHVCPCIVGTEESSGLGIQRLLPSYIDFQFHSFGSPEYWCLRWGLAFQVRSSCKEEINHTIRVRKTTSNIPYIQYIYLNRVFVLGKWILRNLHAFHNYSILSWILRTTGTRCIHVELWTRVMIISRKNCIPTKHAFKLGTTKKPQKSTRLYSRLAKH